MQNKPATKPQKRNINGILLLDKPIGISSNAALQRAKRLFNAKKAGHTGSLDPLATGMLPICFGEATKFSQYLLDSDKCYIVTGKLGVVTTTGDAEGEVIATKQPKIYSQLELEKICQQFVGSIEQIPPMYSALKHQGQPLYKLARKGVIVARKPRQVEIYSIEFINYKNDELSLKIHCSKGTYIRTLIEDIAAVLGCGAHVVKLHRSQVGDLNASDMFSFDQLEAMTENMTHALLPLSKALYKVPTIKISKSSAYYLIQGQAISVPKLPEADIVAIFGPENELIGIGKSTAEGKLAPVRLISNNPTVAD